MNAKEILLIFCQYGFRKASMEDIARATDLSRQSIYKKFGSKEAVFEWALGAAMQEAFAAALAELEDEEKSLEDRLSGAYDRWAGDYIPILRNTPFGGEMFERAMDLYAKKGHTGEDAFYAATQSLMEAQGVAKDSDMAAEMAFTLAMAAKGLLLKSETTDAFRSNMRRILAVILSRP